METLVKSCMDYLKREKSLSLNTLISYERDIRQYATFLSGKGVSESRHAGRQMLNQYIKSLVDSGKSPSTISRSVASLRTFYRYLIKDGKVTGNPIAGLEAPKITKKIPDVLTEQEVEKLLKQPGSSSAKCIRDRAIIKLLCRTGIKVTELISLNLSDFDVENKRFLLKEGKKTREAILTDACLESLVDYTKRSRPYLLKESSEIAFFINSGGRRLSRQGIWKILKKYSEEACLEKNITPYTLRHTLATELIKKGNNVSAVQKALGNSTKSTIKKYNRIAGLE